MVFKMICPALLRKGGRLKKLWWVRDKQRIPLRETKTLIIDQTKDLSKRLASTVNQCLHRIKPGTY